MSGGHFHYKQYEIQAIAEMVEYLINDNQWYEADEQGRLDNCRYSDATVAEFRKGVEALRKAFIYAHRIDWLVSGDDSEDNFHSRLQNELRKEQP